MNVTVTDESPSGKTATLAEQAYKALKHDIMSGALHPGQPLRLEFLKQRYQLSFSPLREALNRLQSERLVDAFALKGFRVSPLSLEEMRDSIDTRIFVDCEALKRSIEHASDTWETQVVATLHALEIATQRKAAAVPATSSAMASAHAPPPSSAASPGSASPSPRKRGSTPALPPSDPAESLYDLLEERHLAFHQALISGCNSRWLQEFSMRLYVQTERYRRPVLLRALGTDPERDVGREHEAIVQAALKRDIATATSLLAEHYRQTGRLIEKSLSA